MPPKGWSLFRSSVLKEFLEFQEEPCKKERERERGLILECE